MRQYLQRCDIFPTPEQRLLPKKNYSLKSRSHDLEIAYEIIKESEIIKEVIREYSKIGINWSGRVILYGSSMGGYDVAYLSSQLNPDAIILSVPAAYSSKAHDVKFGPDFSKIIRERGSWKDSFSYENFRKYPNKLKKEGIKDNVLLVQGLNDKIIPEGLIEKYYESRPVGTEYFKDKYGHDTWDDNSIKRLSKFIRNFQ